MTADEVPSFEAIMRSSGQNHDYHEIDNYTLQPDSHDLIFPSPWINNEFSSLASGSMMPDLPPSLRDANGAAQLNPHGSQGIIIALDEDEEDFSEATATAPLSFNQRSLRLAGLHMQEPFRSAPDVQCDRTSFSSRADSAIGSWDEISSFNDFTDLPDGRLKDSSPITSEDYIYDSRSLQYHRIQPMPYIDQGSLGHNVPSPHAGPSGPASPSPRNSETSQNKLSCPICVNKPPFTGLYAHRNLNRHMESVHAPCSSADGVKHIRCSFQFCDKTFRREDARLVHERRSHPELNRPPPNKRKRSGEL